VAGESQANGEGVHVGEEFTKEDRGVETVGDGEERPFRDGVNGAEAGSEKGEADGRGAFILSASISK
jgi:hypothetical protein